MAYTPFVERTFDSGTPGLSATSEFDDGAAGAVYALTGNYNGTVFVNSTAIPLNENTFTFGGYLGFPNDLVQGQELWTRVRVKPADAFWADCFPHLKFLRLRCESPGGSNTGYADIYINTDGTFKWIREFDGPYTNIFHDFDPSFTITPGTWQTFEVYHKWSADPTQAIVRFWKDGILVGEIKNIGLSTLLNASDLVKMHLLFTYWNGEPDYPTVPHTCGIEDIKMASSASPPEATDAAGNPYIGVESSSGTFLPAFASGCNQTVGFVP